jgi:hypothetical protein
VRAILYAVLLQGLGVGCSRHEAVHRTDAGGPPPVAAPVVPRPPPRLSEAALATHARAFFLNRRDVECLTIVDNDGKLCASVEQPGVPLSDAQIQRAVAAAREPPPPGLDTAPWCFEPHHGVVFYDARDEPVAAISVCFECQRESLWPRHGESIDPPISREAEDAFRRLLCDDLALLPCTPPLRR